MKKMQINFSNNHLTWNLILGIGYIGLGIISLLSNKNGLFFQYGMFAIGIIMLLKNYMERKNPYLTLENGILQSNYQFRIKKYRISDYDSIEKNEKSITLKNNQEKIKIMTSIIEKKSSEILFFEISRIINKNKNVE